MCNQTVGVAKRLDLESISQDIAELIKELDDEVTIECVARKIEEKLEKVIKGKP